MTIIIQDVLDALTAPATAVPNSVDKLLFGNDRTIVSGIAVTFMVTQHVLEQAHRFGANLILTHEGAFYSHHHSLQIHADESVFKAKKQFIEQNDLAVYRVHDFLHRNYPDAIMEGLIRALDWEPYVNETFPTATVVTIPAISVSETAEYVKMRLGISTLRVVGDLTKSCSRIGLLVGNRGGSELAIPLFEQHRLDLIVYGEGPEWETPEYVRDAVHMGEDKALLVLGHLESEQPGMKRLAERLSKMFATVPVHFIPVDSVFKFV
ncbi:MAG: Nif3-like dinuclear metal center hexameric protein [Candidatus Cohnella colombiensis]|uniref:GTP cyclohydrolase 1 type 2 homolog n=1 Tax=Candidatus Cohnella colombiensis TaxID=3121368 RepID=A0AA95ETD1_9BACL|nr:MAG: Nif3-like dinuclear metal center hexameric protein [Cohnella sp.]